MAGKNIVIVEVKPPIPSHDWDFCAYLEGTDENGVFGWGETEEEAKDDLAQYVDLFDEEEEEEDAEVEE